MVERSVFARALSPIAGFALSVVLVGAACGDEARDRSSDDDDTSGAGANGAGTSTSAGAGGGASATTGAGGGAAAPIAVCLAACGTPADCDLGAGPAYDADNYACVDGGCVYQGCLSDAECQAQGDYLCRDVGGLATCVVTCDAPADCDLGAGPAYDADNYACVSGGCVYQGCNTTSECQTLGDYVCHDAGLGTRHCFPACAGPADCDLGAGPAFDADNYTCDEGACLYAGCNDTSECAALGDYVCADASPP